jgi:hypothetical protein
MDHPTTVHSPSPAQATRRPRSSQTTVSMNWDDADALSPHNARLKFQVAECIETKTVTTTTTTKRSYPPLFVREPRSLVALDSKEYPLAQKPTPPELANFTFDASQHGSLSWPTDEDVDLEDVGDIFFSSCMHIILSNNEIHIRQARSIRTDVCCVTIVLFVMMH